MRPGFLASLASIYQFSDASLFALVRAMFGDAWNRRRAQAEGVRKSLKHEISDIENQTDRLL
jgi:hypothetical protein